MLQTTMSTVLLMMVLKKEAMRCHKAFDGHFEKERNLVTLTSPVCFCLVTGPGDGDDHQKKTSS